MGDTEPPKDLRSFLDQIRTEDPEEVVVVRREVSPLHEMSAVVKALEARGNPIVVFESVAGSDFPAVYGVCGSRGRIARALGVPEPDCVEWALRIGELETPARVAVGGPVGDHVATGADVDLGLLPLAVHSRGDAGRYITAGVTVVRDPCTGRYNTGIYRLMVVDRNHITLNSSPPHDLGRALQWSESEKRPLEFAVVIGHHPALLVSSQFKNPATVDSYALCGTVAGQPLAITPAATVDLEVPAFAEAVLEGRVMPGDRLQEGPFGEFTYYHGAANGFVGEVTAITRRDAAMFQDLHPAHVEHRALWLFPGREARLLGRLRDSVPGVRAVRLPLHGAGMSAYISMEKSHDGDATRALMAALSSDNYIKHAFVVDEDIDIFDDAEVLWALNVRFQADRYLLVVNNARGIRMDPSAYSLLDRNVPGALTTKLGFDATFPLGRPRPERADFFPDEYSDLAVEDYLE